MNSEGIKEIREGLFRVGFTVEQVERLSQFRQNYLEKEQQQVLVERNRLEFLRWLVATGRLSA